jgi:hypothetical protein
LFRGATLPTSSKKVARDKEKSMKKTSSNSRRLLGAFAVGATVVSAVVFAGAGTGMAATGALSLNYSCPFPLLGAQDMTVSISVDGLPDAAVAGVPTSEAHVVATATVGGGPTWGLNLFGAKTIEGTSVTTTTIDNAGTAVNASPTLTVPSTPVPASGTFDAVASGTVLPVTFANAGTTTYSVGGFSTTLTPRKADGSLTGLGTFTSDCTLKPGQNTTLYSLTVAPATTP